MLGSSLVWYCVLASQEIGTAKALYKGSPSYWREEDTQKANPQQCAPREWKDAGFSRHKPHPGACQKADEQFIRSSLGQRFKVRVKKHTQIKSEITLLKSLIQDQSVAKIFKCELFLYSNTTDKLLTHLNSRLIHLQTATVSTYSAFQRHVQDPAMSVSFSAAQGAESVFTSNKISYDSDFFPVRGMKGPVGLLRMLFAT